MSGYIGVVPLPQATQTRDVFTATSGQTTFATSGYTPNFLDVWLNGVKLVNGDDFTATNGSDIVLTSGATAGDTVEVLSYSTFEVNSQTFTGTTTLTGDLQATTATFSGAVTGTSATLSGGVYLGGTGSANLLDDYETGTWTPTLEVGTNITYNSRSGTYTKVGRMVYISGYIDVSNSDNDGSAIQISLPFTGSTGSESAVFYLGRYFDFLGASGTSVCAARFTGNRLIPLISSNTGLSYTEANSSGVLTFSAVYEVL